MYLTFGGFTGKFLTILSTVSDGGEPDVWAPEVR